jgi:hypothetical protein
MKEAPSICTKQCNVLELSVVDSDALVDTEGDGDMDHVELLVVVTLSDGLVESEWDSDCTLSAV